MIALDFIKHCIRKIKYHPVEIVNNYFYRPRLIDNEVLNRFAVLRFHYSKICNKFISNQQFETDADGYSWDSWSGQIRNAFRDGVEIDFLSNPVISFTMVFAKIFGIHKTEIRIGHVIQMLGKDLAHKILKEDYIGLPTISNSEFLTSANRAHHAMHLSFYHRMEGKYFWESESIIEWGGGYGNMARIIRRMNPKVTYIIIDLPELLALQYVYLGSIEGEDAINCVLSSDDQIQKGKINLISSETVVKSKNKLNAENFISTWAITECPISLQDFVYNQDFFGAINILLASKIDRNNRLNFLMDKTGFSIASVPDLNDSHEYWAK